MPDGQIPVMRFCLSDCTEARSASTALTRVGIVHRLLERIEVRIHLARPRRRARGESRQIRHLAGRAVAAHQYGKQTAGQCRSLQYSVLLVNRVRVKESGPVAFIPDQAVPCAVRGNLERRIATAAITAIRTAARTAAGAATGTSTTAITDAAAASGVTDTFAAASAAACGGRATANEPLERWGC